MIWPLSAVETAWLMIGTGALGGLAGAFATSRVMRSFRREVPRHVRERTDRRGLATVDVLLGNHFTGVGRAWRRLAIATLPAALSLALGAILLLRQPDQLADRTVVVALSLLGSQLILALLTSAGLSRAKRIERTLVYDRSAGLALQPAQEEFGPEFRRLCACCGYPTVSPHADDAACWLCDWSRDVEATLALAVARSNFDRFRTVFAPDRTPEWRPAGLSALELARRGEAVDLFERYRRSPEGFRSHGLWAHRGV